MKSILIFLTVLLLGSQYGEALDKYNELDEIKTNMVETISTFWSDRALPVEMSELQNSVSTVQSAIIFGQPKLYVYDGETFSECREGDVPNGIVITVSTDNISATITGLMSLPYVYHSVEVYGDRSAIVLYVAIGGESA